MKISDMRGKDSRELRLDEQSLRKELFELRLRSVSEGITETARFRAIRRHVARIETVLRERQISQAAGGGQPDRR